MSVSILILLVITTLGTFIVTTLVIDVVHHWNDKTDTHVEIVGGQMNMVTEKKLVEFANDPVNLGYRNAVVYDMPDGQEYKPARNYSTAMEIRDELPQEATNAQIINLIAMWEG